MTLNLQCYGRFSTRIGNQVEQGGSLETPISISIDGEVHRRVVDIAVNANATIYNDDLGTFNFLFLASDLNTRVLVTDTNSNTFAFRLRGVGVQAGSTTLSKFGVPFMLGADETTDNTNTINTIQVFNEDTNTAKVLLVVIK